MHKKHINEYKNKDYNSVDHPLAVFQLDATENDTITYFMKVKTDYLLSPIFFLADEIQIHHIFKKKCFNGRM